MSAIASAFAAYRHAQAVHGQAAAQLAAAQDRFSRDAPVLSGHGEKVLAAATLGLSVHKAFAEIAAEGNLLVARAARTMGSARDEALASIARDFPGEDAADLLDCALNERAHVDRERGRLRAECELDALYQVDEALWRLAQGIRDHLVELPSRNLADLSRKQALADEEDDDMPDPDLLAAIGRDIHRLAEAF